MSLIVSFFTGLILIYLAINGYLYFFQRSILYVPDPVLASPESYGLESAEEVTLYTLDKVALTAWFMPAQKNQPYLVYFHGNAGNLGGRADKLQAFANQGWGVIALSYRGYGSSHGKPSEAGLYIDARTAISFLLERGIDRNNMILYGESLGSGIATQMATEHNYRALVLEAPYTSIANRAAELYPYIPVKLLLKDQLKSIDKISAISTPVLIFHGLEDDVMPVSHGKRMFAQATEPKAAHFLENVGHTDFDMGMITQHIHSFMVTNTLQ